MALESHEPEIVWIILHRKLATPQEISQALTWATSEKGAILGASAEDRNKAEDIIKLLKTFGTKEIMPPINTQMQTKATPKSSHAQSPISPSVKVSPPSAKQHAPRGNRGRGRGRGRGGHYAPPAH